MGGIDAEVSQESLRETGYRDVLLHVLEAIAKHAVSCGEELGPFRTLVAESMETLRGPATASEVFTSGGLIAQAIEHYFTLTQKSVEELQAQLASATLPVAQRGPQDARPALLDASTGLPRRPEAEAAMRRALDGAASVQCFAAIFYVHRMALTNARFGEAIGNQVILFCSQQLATIVTGPNDALFRWSGPAFVAILEREDMEGAVYSEMQRLLAAPSGQFFETSSRSVYLPVKMTVEVIPLFNTSFDDALARLENFVLKTSGQPLV